VAKKSKKLTTRFAHQQLDNACKTLLANIRFASVDEQVKTIVVTSSMMDEGKTMVATNLANAIATAGKHVLMVEGDMHHPMLSNLLGIYPEHGLFAAASGTVALEKVIVRTQIPNIYFLGAEQNIPCPSDLLSTKRCANIIARLRKVFDYIIFDTPPVSLFVDAAILASIADGTVFVVRQGETKREQALKSVQQLRVAGAHLLGTVVTFCTGKDTSYYYDYYYENGARAQDGTGLPMGGTITDDDAATSDGFRSQIAAEVRSPLPGAAEADLLGQAANARVNPASAGPYKAGSFKHAAFEPDGAVAAAKHRRR